VIPSPCPLDHTLGQRAQRVGNARASAKDCSGRCEPRSDLAEGRLLQRKFNDPRLDLGRGPVRHRRNDRLEALANEFGLVRIHPVVLDVRDRTAVEAAIGGLPPDFAELDLLVNNAGLAAGLDPAQNADLDAWDAMVDTNVKGLMYVTRAVLPGMVARNRGLIINLGSTAATYPYPGGNVYEIA